MINGLLLYVSVTRLSHDNYYTLCIIINNLEIICILIIFKVEVCLQFVHNKVKCRTSSFIFVCLDGVCSKVLLVLSDSISTSTPLIPMLVSSSHEGQIVCGW